MKIRIGRGTAKTVTVAADTATVKGASTQIWVVKPGVQNTLFATLSAGQSQTLGPYINIVEFDLVTVGTVTVTDAAIDFGDPVAVSPVNTGSLTTIQQASLDNSRAQLFKKLRIKLAATKNGSADTRILLAGTSIDSGAYSSDDLGATGEWKEKSWLNRLAGMFNNTLPAYCDSFMGFKDSAHDKRIVFGSPWSQLSEVASLTTVGGTIATSTSNTSGFLEYTPLNQVNSFRIWYAKNTGAGVLGYNINGSGAGTINQTGTAAFTSTTVTTTLGINTLKLNWASGGNVYVCGIEAWNSTVKSIRFINAGWDGSTTAQWADTSSVFSPGNFATMGCDAHFFSLGVNDLQPARNISVDAFKANYEPLIVSALTLGDILLITENPSEVVNSISLAAQALYWQVTFDFATKYNSALLDYYNRIGSYESNPDYYATGAWPIRLHGSMAGNLDKAQAAFNILGTL